MKNILVPTDFSECSKYASDAAYLLAKRFGAKLHLVSSLGLAGDQPMASGEGPVETQMNELCQAYPDVTCHTALMGKNLPENIKTYVKDHGMDLVVMGSHGASGKNEYFIGSNTQKVVRTVHCPVLVVKKPLEKIDFQRVVFAAGFHLHEITAFERFKDFILHFMPEVHLVAIHSSPLDMPFPLLKEAMEPFKKACNPLVCHTHVYRDISVDEGIRSFANEIKADLIAISNHERHPLKRMLIGSNVELLVNHSDLPVLTIDFE